MGIAGGATRESLVRRPGSVPIALHVHLKRGVKVRLRVAAVDPYRRRAALLLPFTSP